jgi:hypothetical protein
MLCTIVVTGGGIYAFLWVTSWMLAELSIIARAKKNGCAPLRLEFMCPGRSPDLSQSVSQRLIRLSVRQDEGETATLWVAYGPCYLGLTLAQEAVLLRKGP